MRNVIRVAASIDPDGVWPEADLATIRVATLIRIRTQFRQAFFLRMLTAFVSQMAVPSSLVVISLLLMCTCNV